MSKHISEYPKFTNWLPKEPGNSKCAQMASRTEKRIALLINNDSFNIFYDSFL